MTTSPRLLWLALLLLASFTHPAIAESKALVTLDMLLDASLQNDPWQVGSEANERALKSAAVAAAALPDPKLSLSVANLPTDSFEFSQEPMTQLVVGVSQSFPAGKTRTLRRQKLANMGDIQPIERVLRNAKLQRQITALWVQAAQAAGAIALITKDRRLFTQLLDVTRAGYSSAARRVGQQDVIRAELELTRLAQRVIQLEQEKLTSLQQLLQWVPQPLLQADQDWTLGQVGVPEVAVTATMLSHPEVVIIDQQINVLRFDRALAEASKQPGWSVNSSYAYRDSDFNGRELPDFFSVGVSLDLPLFTANRRSQQVASASARVSALETTRLLKVRELMARRADARTASVQLDRQLQLYVDELLPQIDSLAQAALDAYGADRADFADVMRAYITRLNANIEKLRIETQLADTRSELAYLAAVFSQQTGDKQ